MQTDSVSPAPSLEVSGVKQDCELTFRANSYMNSVSILLALKGKKLQNEAALSRRLMIIHIVESVFESKCHQVDELTSKNLSIKPSLFWFRLLKLCEMLFQRANAVVVESQDSSLLRKKRSHRQEYLISLNVRNCLVYLATARLFLPMRNQSAIQPIMSSWCLSPVDCILKIMAT